MKWSAVAMVVAVMLAGCTKPNPLSCTDGSCTDPNFPFCDVGGQFGDSSNTCIAVSCTASQFVACRGNDALTCNAVGNNYDVMPCPVACDDQNGGCVECTSDTDCSAPRPHCGTAGSCIECVDSTQCTDPTKPFCDSTTNECHACATDMDCESRVCDDVAGTCVDESSIVYAAVDGAALNCGTLASPCSFQGAINHLTTQSVIKLLPGTYTTPVVSIGKSYVLHGDDATMSPNDAAATGIELKESTTNVRIIGLTLVRGAGAGANTAVTCSTTDSFFPTLTLDRVSVTVPGNGVRACVATATRSSFTATGGVSGLLLQAFAVSRCRFEGGGAVGLPTTGPLASGAVIENSLFVNASPAANGSSGGGATVRFSTFVDSQIVCGSSTGGPTADTLNLADNIMVSTTAAPVETGQCGNHHVVVLPAPPVRPNDDHVIAADPLFKDPVNHDYHLSATSPAVDAADPAATTSVDLDGSPRPVGTGRDIGAYELQ